MKYHLIFNKIKSPPPKKKKKKVSPSLKPYYLLSMVCLKIFYLHFLNREKFTNLSYDVAPLSFCLELFYFSIYLKLKKQKIIQYFLLNHQLMLKFNLNSLNRILKSLKF